jgi:hypothetical protein
MRYVTLWRGLACGMLALAGGVVWGQSATNQNAPAQTQPNVALQVGVTQKLTAEANAEAHYKLYLPKAYAQDPERIFPLLINQNPSGKTNLKPYEAWAEAQEVILLGIDGISNGKIQGLKNTIADAVLADLVARQVRAHPTLRLVIGMSGGSADGIRLVRRKPEHYAGCVIMGAGGILDKPNAKHLAYAILGGAKDEWMPGDACAAMAEQARALGCAVRLEVELDRQHKEAPLEQQTAALTWLLELQQLQLPALSADARAANLAVARERMKAVAKITPADARRSEAELLLSLVPLKTYSEERTQVVAAWASAMTELCAALPNAGERHTFLCTAVLAGPYAVDLTPEAKTAFEQQVTELRKDAAVAKDWSLRQRYSAAEALESSAGLKPEKLALALPLWEALAKDVAGTPWEALVAWRIRIVKLLIEMPSTIQNPTKLEK